MSNSKIGFMRVDRFLDDINRDGCFDTNDMDGVSMNYRIFLASECAKDFEDCIDSDGTLIVPYDATRDVGVNLIDTLGEDDGLCAMLWSKGVNGERTMSVATTSVSYDFGDSNVSIKAFFLVNITDGSGYVVAYNILDRTMTEDGVMVCPTDGMVWSMKYGG